MILITLFYVICSASGELEADRSHDSAERQQDFRRRLTERKQTFYQVSDVDTVSTDISLVIASNLCEN